MRDDARTANVLLALGHGDQSHDLAVEFELDLGVWQEARLLTDSDGDRHLTFGGNANVRFLTLTCKSKNMPVWIQGRWWVRTQITASALWRGNRTA